MKVVYFVERKSYGEFLTNVSGSRLTRTDAPLAVVQLYPRYNSTIVQLYGSGTIGPEGTGAHLGWSYTKRDSDSDSDRGLQHRGL